MRPLLIFLLALMPVCLMAQSFNYEIRGSIKNYKPGQKMYFMHSDKGQIIVSVLIANGKFSFKGKTAISNEPAENHDQSSAKLFIDQKGKGINFKRIAPDDLDKINNVQLYLEPGITLVSITGAINNAVVKPPYPNTGYYTLDSIKQAMIKKVNITDNEARRKYGAKSDLSKYTEKQRNKIGEEEEKDEWRFIKDHPSSPVSLYILQHNISVSYADASFYYSGLSSKLKQTKFGQRYASFINRVRSVEVGRYAPVFTLKTTDGKPISLTSYKGKYVLIDFWASWCGPCRDENPNLLRVYKKFKSRNFTVLGVSLDEDKIAWKKAIVDDHLDWTHVSDLKGWDNVVAKLYAVRYVPQNFLIDPQGRIISHTLYDLDLENKLGEIFHQPKK